MNIDRLISDRVRAINGSGIRRVFELGAKLKDPINLSIGQPHFAVPEPIKRAAIDAIGADRNGYTLTQGIAELRARIERELAADVGWRFGEGSDSAVMVTSGTSGALLLAAMAVLGPGDELIIPDPYFVMYPHLATLTGARAVPCDTYPDFRLTAERVERLITPRTKMVILCSPGNPTGVVTPGPQARELLELCRRRNILLVSDEIYDAFTYTDSRTETRPGDGRAAGPSPARAGSDLLLVRGFGKTYGVTGWRLGYAAGPKALIDQMSKLQQFTFVCAPSALQWGCIAAMDVDMEPHVAAYQRNRDLVLERLSPLTEIATPGGAFYAYPRVPARLGLTGSQFMERCIGRNMLVVPGAAFSTRDTHIRISFATSEKNLQRGLEVLADLMG